jgi:hypothetical protein
MSFSNKTHGLKKRFSAGNQNAGRFVEFGYDATLRLIELEPELRSFAFG